MFTTELQYTVVRYMLNDLGDEAANVGVVAVTEDPLRIMIRFLEDPTVKSRNDARIRRDAVDRFAAYAKTQIQEIESRAVEASPQAAALLGRLREFGGNLIRVNSPRSVLTNDVEKEFDLLFHQWVAPASGSELRKAYGPRDPLGGLRREATRAVVRAFREGHGRPLTRKVFARSYEVRGVSHKNIFDIAVLSGTKKNRREHLFQHLLLLPDPDDTFTQAAALCWRWSDIQAANNANRNLTAVLYERADQRSRGLAETARILKGEHIEVAHLQELPTLVRKLENQGHLF